MALSKAALKRIIGAVPEPEDDDIGKWVVGVIRSIEAEVRKQDEALILQLVEALEYHRAQTRPIHQTNEAIIRGRARLQHL